MNALNQNLYGQIGRRRRRTYRLKEVIGDNSFSDEDIRNRFRFKRESITYLVNLLKNDLERPTKRNHALSVETQVLISLRFFAI